MRQKGHEMLKIDISHVVYINGYTTYMDIMTGENCR